ncbi:uncharacterized protein N7482_000071 [Penicillium canariense]|uniref:C2H2-type domain-containing protein n=1 Tax=Penicillium canariense TaxID=189055 RepID=A0A9W9IDI3_9EURO|nr:uncharacterized protein N7482_000071 [Penicillium canariense]KAJ5174194.1 hypothetical protein N7482_000071 [Penicillium canariense]
MSFFYGLFTRAQQQDRDILLIVSGWDGLTTNQGAFQKLFVLRPESVSVHLRILSVNHERLEENVPPPCLYDVDIHQVCAVWAGDLDQEDPDVKFNWSTELYLKFVPAIATSKMNLSKDYLELHRYTHERNVHRWAGPRHKCGFTGCNEEFFTAGSRDKHQSVKHRPPVTEEAIARDIRARTCGFCGKLLARIDTRSRHEKICSDNPDRETGPSQSKPTSRYRRPVDPTTVPVVQGAVKEYRLLDVDEVLRLPRIDPDAPVIYRGERFCRYPGCQYTRGIERQTHLRRHYDKDHQLVLPTLRTSVSKAVQDQHDRGLQWLSRCVYLGRVDGEPPSVGS